MSQLEVWSQEPENSLQSLWVEYVRLSLVALSLWEEEDHVDPDSLHPQLPITQMSFVEKICIWNFMKQNSKQIV